MKSLSLRAAVLALVLNVGVFYMSSSIADSDGGSIVSASIGSTPIQTGDISFMVNLQVDVSTGEWGSTEFQVGGITTCLANPGPTGGGVYDKQFVLDAPAPAAPYPILVSVFVNTTCTPDPFDDWNAPLILEVVDVAAPSLKAVTGSSGLGCSAVLELGAGEVAPGDLLVASISVGAFADIMPGPNYVVIDPGSGTVDDPTEWHKLPQNAPPPGHLTTPHTFEVFWKIAPNAQLVHPFNFGDICVFASEDAPETETPIGANFSSQLQVFTNVDQVNPLADDGFNHSLLDAPTEIIVEDMTTPDVTPTNRNQILNLIGSTSCDSDYPLDKNGILKLGSGLIYITDPEVDSDDQVIACIGRFLDDPDGPEPVSSHAWSASAYALYVEGLAPFDGDSPESGASVGASNFGPANGANWTGATLAIQPPNDPFKLNVIFNGGGGHDIPMTLGCTDGTIIGDNPQTIGSNGSLEWEVDDAAPDTTCDITPGATGPYYVVENTCTAMPLLTPGECNIVLGQTYLTIDVVKIYSDGNTQPVEVHIDCNDSLIPDHTKTLHEGNDWSHRWVVTQFTSGATDCHVTETPVTGYEPHYAYAGIENGQGLISSGTPTTNDEGCHFTGLVGGEEGLCKIFNELQEVSVDVTKVWVDEHKEFNNSTFIRAKWACSNTRYSKFFEGLWYHYGLSNDKGHMWFKGYTGPDTERTFSVLPNWDPEHPTICNVYEKIRDSSIEADISDCQEIELYPGIYELNDKDEPVNVSCTLINTRIYEGVPTLSQYGLALMALLMLGMGMVGFRRFS